MSFSYHQVWKNPDNGKEVTIREVSKDQWKVVCVDERYSGQNMEYMLESKEQAKTFVFQLWVANYILVSKK